MKDLRKIAEEGELIFKKISALGGESIYFLLPEVDLAFIECLAKYEETAPKNVFLIINEKINIAFKNLIKITANEINILIKYYSLFNFYEDFYILSFRIPYDTHAENLIWYKNTKLKDIIECDIFKMDKLIF